MGILTSAARRAILAAVLLGGFRASESELAAQVVNFTNYTGVDGLPQSQVFAVLQDRSSYLWLGTYGGLTRFDGVEFRTYARPEGLPSTAVSALAEDRGGRLIVGTLGAGVCVFDRIRFRCIGRRQGLPDQDVTDVMADPAGGFWVGTEEGLAFVDDQLRVRVYSAADGLPDSHVTRLARGADGAILIGTDRGLARLDRERLTVVDVGELAGRPIRIIQPHHGGLLVGTSSQLALIRDGRAAQLSGMGGVPQVEFVAAVSDTAGLLWIATRSGVIRHDGREAQLLTDDAGLGNHDVNALTLDREGNVWFGTENGLSKLTPGAFSQYTQREGIPHPFVRSIVEDASGRLWVGTRDGIAVLERDRFVAPDLPGVRNRRVYGMGAIGDTLLVGTRDGLVVYRNGVRRVIGTADGLPSEFVTAVLPDPAGGAWIGTAQGVARFEGGRIRAMSDSLLQAVFATALAYGPGGTLWVGRRAGGVVVWEGGRSRRIGAMEGLTDQAVWALAPDASGAMWIGTNGDGALILRPDGRIDRLTMADGLVNDFVWQTLHDRAGDVWLFTSQGLERYTSSGLVHYGTGDGLKDVEGSANAAFQDRRGNLWFGTGSGVIKYVAAHDVPNRVRPPVYLEAVTSRHGAMGDDGRIAARPGMIRVRYSAPSFRDPTKVRFRTRLIGVDDRWSDPTTDRSVSFAGLAPGTYTFEVEATNDNGSRSAQPAAVSFTVAPSFWQTWWFRSLALLVLGLAAASIPILRSRQLRRDHQRLEALVAQHTTTLAAQNAQLEREVSERIAAEEEARRQEQRVREVVEHSTNLFYSYTRDHEITYFSPQVLQFIGVEADSGPRRWPDLLTDHPCNEAGMARSRRAIASGEKQPPYELELRAGPGRRIWVEVNEAPVVRDGRTTAIVGSLTNISEAKAAREKQQRLEAQLQQAQKMEAVGRLAGGIAHDFNNLLTAVVGHTDFAAESLPADSPAQADLAVIRRASDRAASLVAQLLAFSRQQMVTRRAIDLNVVSAEAVRMLQRVLGSDVEVVLDLADAPAWVLADHGQLDQILLNLAVNARDAMPTGGRLVIGTEPVDVLEPLDDDVPAGQYVVLRVSDTGSGMDEVTRSRVFEPFFTTKKVGEGTGLGLAMVYGIVKQHGGHIAVETEVHRGATFRLYLPRAAAPAAATAPAAVARPRPPLSANGARRVVLVVEDEDGVRKLACRTLSMHGFEVLEAPNGQAAIDLAERFAEPIDLLLSDMIMPGMNGKQVAQSIAERRAGIKVLYMSGHADGVLGRNGLIEQEGTHLLRKPFTPSELARQVQDLLAV